mmetsp:Transcript_77115/g.152850  ORF Transcript_77115/g.152850 Transcript_77115/m.152850 type:complete len:251 (-) Transcript_77115:77-829(-)
MPCSTQACVKWSCTSQRVRGSMAQKKVGQLRMLAARCGHVATRSHGTSIALLLLQIQPSRNPWQRFLMVLLRSHKTVAWTHSITSRVLIQKNRPSDQHHDSVARVRHEDAQKSLLKYNNGVTRDFTNQVISECTRLTTLSGGLSSGFCHADSAAGQDCELLEGIRAGWGTKYGGSFCTSLPGPGVLRCQALRRQLVEVAEAKSNFIFKTAYFTKFDEVAKISRHSCPAQAFPEADNVGEVTQAEIVDDDE